MEVGKLYQITAGDGWVVGETLKAIPATRRHVFFQMSSSSLVRRFYMKEIFMMVTTLEVQGNQSDPVYEGHAVVLFEEKLYVFDEPLTQQVNFFRMVGKPL